MAKVQGLNELIGRLRKMDANIQSEVKQLIDATGGQIVTDALRNLGNNKAGASGDRQIGRDIVIYHEVLDNGYSTRVTVENQGNLAAYREFGTGLSAAQYLPSLPVNWQKMAMSFYVNGQGKMIKRPYFYPAYYKNTHLLKIDFIQILKEQAKKAKR